MILALWLDHDQGMRIDAFANVQLQFFRRARGPSEEPSPPAPDQTSPEAAWESSLLFPGMSGGLTTCIHLLRCMLAASLHISSYFSEIQWFHSACFRRILIVPRLIEWLDICVNNEYWFTCGFTGWHMGVRSVQWWMEHACLRVCKLRPCTFLSKGWENNQMSTVVECVESELLMAQRGSRSANTK